MNLPETIKYPEAQKRYSCSRRTLERAIKAGFIVAYQPGASILMEKDSADAWFFSTKIKTAKKIGRPRNLRRMKG